MLPHRLKFELILAFFLKVIAIFIIFLLFYQPSNRYKPSAQEMVGFLTGPIVNNH